MNSGKSFMDHTLRVVFQKRFALRNHSNSISQTFKVLNLLLSSDWRTKKTPAVRLQSGWNKPIVNPHESIHSEVKRKTKKKTKQRETQPRAAGLNFRRNLRLFCQGTNQHDDGRSGGAGDGMDVYNRQLGQDSHSSADCYLPHWPTYDSVQPKKPTKTFQLRESTTEP